MKKTTTPGETPATFDPEALYLKAGRYIEHRSEFDSDDWEYALWSSLSLEFLGRAALANVSPALLAEVNSSNWASLYHALGFTPSDAKFAPRSITISEVFKRLASILPDFAKEHENFGIQHTGLRNAELHSGEPAFDGIKGSTWQPRFYQTCKVLLASMGMTLANFVGQDDAKLAQQLIEAATDDSAKAVGGDVSAHTEVWLAKTESERTTLAMQARIFASRYAGHRVDCPACLSQALLTGEPVSAPTKRLGKRLGDGEITETQEYLPNRFECVACGLKITGLSRLTVVGLSDRYKKTQIYDAAEYYAPEDDYAGYEEDNNEP